MKKPRTLSLFSGIGGLDLGLERAGFQIVAQCEAAPFCRAVLAKHWPGVPCFEDVRYLASVAEYNREVFGTVECVCGGFPCQDVSVAGKGAGVEKGERSGLWREMLRIVDALRPRWVIAENVPALRTRGADRVLGDLEGLGYTATPLVVGAETLGAPHRRHRVFIVADASRGGLGADGRARGHDRHADECGAVGDSELPRLEGLGADAGRSEVSESGDAGAPVGNAHVGARREQEPGRGTQGGVATRWPSPPGCPQHDWEAPWLVELNVGRAASRLPGGLVRYLELTDADAEKAGPCEIMRLLQGRDDAAEVQRTFGGSDPLSAAPLLQRAVHGRGPDDGQAGTGHAAEADAQSGTPRRRVRGVRGNALPGPSPQEPGQEGQQAGERADVVRGLPCSGALADGSALVVCVSKAIGKRLRTVNRHALRAYGNAVVPQVAELIGRAILSQEAA